MFRKPIKESLVTFPAEESQLREIKSYVESVCLETTLKRKEIDSILLAVEEACTNVIRHAYLYGSGTIRIKITLDKERIIFTIIDTGRSFDFDSSGSPDLDRYVETGRKGGLGIYLIRKVMDDVTYRTTRGENHLRMVKQLPKPAALPKPVGMSIRVKFSIWTAAILFFIVTIAYFYFDSRTRASIASDFKTDIEELSKTIASQASALVINDRSDPEFDELAVNFKSENQEVRYLVITDGSGRVRAHTEDPTAVYTQYDPPDGITVDSIGRLQATFRDGVEVYHVVEPIFPDEPELGYVHMGVSDAARKADVAQSRKGILIIAALSYAFGIVAVWFLANYFVKPIQKITEGVRRLGSSEEDEAIPIEGADEFSAIAHAFNEMKVKIKEAQKNEVEKERIQKEMQVAQEIQQTLLPKQFPDIEGYDIATIYRAAKDVGGDYFDFVWIDEDTLGIIVADVSGKGVPGSLVMTMIRTAIRLEARGNRSATDILTRVNEFISDDVKKGMFITIFLVVLDTKNRKISFASAGHDPMILYRKDEDKSYFLNPRGIPVGITLPDGMNFEEIISSQSVKLKKDDILVIYTDGITEAMNHRREQYGMEKLLKFIQDNSQLTPDEFVEKLNEDIMDFTQGAEQNDDITLVAIKEKIMADAYILARRKRLLGLVENHGMTVKDACREMGVSTSTYYKYKKRFDLYGEEGLLNKELRIDSAPRMLAFDERRKLLDAVKENPEYGSARLKSELAGEKFGKIDVDERIIYDELVRLRLNTKRMRLEYAARQGKGLSDEQQQILAQEQEKHQQKIEQNKKEYLEKVKKAAAEAGNGTKKALPELVLKMTSFGLPEEDVKQFVDAVTEADTDVDRKRVLDLLEKLADRASQAPEDDATPRVLDQSRFRKADVSGWKKVEESGIDLNSLDNEEESDTFDFDSYAKKLGPGKDESDDNA